jgi:hypothetical protein
MPPQSTINKYQKYYYNASINTVQYNEALADWLQSKIDADEWKLFTCTIVFKPIDRINTQTRYEDEYKNRVLRKIRRRLERHLSSQSTAIPYENWFQFERYEKSRYRATGKRCPFHIHSLIPIRSYQVHRFWNEDENRLNSRLHKDLHSIDIVQDVLIEPVREVGPFAWLMYSSKQKPL